MHGQNHIKFTMKTSAHMWQFVTEFFLECDVLFESFRRNQNTSCIQ